jgi:DNA-binding response OmpR family regulator
MTRDSRSCRVLVAEDDAGVRDLVRTRLFQAGYDVHTARNGGEALRRIRELQPNVVVLDINMPELDGFGVLKALEADPAPGTRILVLTARHAADDVRRAMALGAKDYLAKPFNDAQLLARVARLTRPPKPVLAAPDDILL